MQWRDRTVLVTGGTGFVGSYLVERLLAEGAKVRVPIRAKNYRALSARRSEVDWREGDLRDGEYCQSIVAGVDHVFHLASCRRMPDDHRNRASDVLNANVGMTLAMLEGIREHGPVPVTLFSTANVPLDTDIIALARAEEVDGYVLGKALSEVLWLTAQRQRPFPLLIVRAVGAYGPRDTFSEEANVIPSFMVRTRSAKKALELWGSGDEQRTFLYVEDLVDSVLSLIAADATGIQYISSPEAWTMRELAESIRDLVRPDLPVHFDHKHPVSPRIIPLPMHPALRSFPWTPLSEGLKRTYDWWSNAQERPETKARRKAGNRATLAA